MPSGPTNNNASLDDSLDCKAGAQTSTSKVRGVKRSATTLPSGLRSNNNNNKLYLHDHNKVLQYCKSYLKLIIDSLQIKYLK